MKVYEEYQYGGYRECGKPHHCGLPVEIWGGTENIVVEDMVYPLEGNGSRESHHGPGYNESNSMFTLNTVERHAVAQVSTGGVQMAVDVRNSKEADINGALQSRASNNVQSNNVVRQQYAVRRLTPLECERLQGLPDNFTLIDDKSCSDSARYKAIGNGMCQNCADFVIRRIVEEVNGYAYTQTENQKT